MTLLNHDLCSILPITATCLFSHQIKGPKRKHEYQVGLSLLTFEKNSKANFPASLNPHNKEKEHPLPHTNLYERPQRTRTKEGKRTKSPQTKKKNLIITNFQNPTRPHLKTPKITKKSLKLLLKICFPTGELNPGLPRCNFHCQKAFLKSGNANHYTSRDVLHFSSQMRRGER